MRKVVQLLVVIALATTATGGGIAGAHEEVAVSDFTVDKDALCKVRDAWIEDILRTHPQGTWAEMKLELSDRDLELMGLPPRDVLTAQRYPKPTLVTTDGRTYEVPTSTIAAAMRSSSDPTVATFAGVGCLGIRPGAFLLIIEGGSISLCSMAHLYGGSISTAGHCAGTGATATVIAATGNRPDATGVVLLDFGTFGHSTDGGLGNDHALISINSAYSSLVTPTMCFWGGPRGRYDAVGDVAAVGIGGGGPSVSVTPDPFLAQAIVHYGHGLGIGAGGTPRVGNAIAWRPNHFMFSGAITPGDSGSGANTLLGDSIGANMEAAGIITHIWVDPLMRDGIGIMGGTRATQVGTPTDGQIVPYPAPVSGGP